MRRSLQQKGVWLLCGLSIFFTLHMVLPVYSNSSFLSSVTSVSFASGTYIVAAFLTIFALIETARIIRKINVGSLVSYVVLLEAIAVGLLAVSNITSLIIAAFIIHLIATVIIFFLLDMYLEHLSDEKETGQIRGLYLTAINAAYVVAPILTGLLVKENNYLWVYVGSLFFLIPFSHFLKSLPKVHITKQKSPHFLVSLKRMMGHKDKRIVFALNLLLKLFFAWMVVYMPIHLHENIGFDFTTIGIIFSIMLTPYLLLEFPLGRIADVLLGEKELLVVGFFLLTALTIPLAFVTSTSALVWSVLLFGTRIGAAMVEILSESYFFKHVGSRDADDVSVFRMTQPLSYIIAPLLALPFLTLASTGVIFSFAGILMAVGIPLSLTLTDTR